MDFPEALSGSVWHTTTPERYTSIARDGCVLPNPPVPDTERWGTAMGPSHYPYVRSIGGVSLFDFRKFDPERYSERYPLSSWREFVPCSHRSERAIWIEINLRLVKEKFIEGAVLVERWKSSGELRRKIMPLVEAAHIGPLPASAFTQILIYEKATNEFRNAG